MSPDTTLRPNGHGIELGVDTLCYHLRLTDGELSHRQVAAEVAELGFRWLQLNAKTGGLTDWTISAATALGDFIKDLGLGVIYSGMDVGGKGSDKTEVRAQAQWWLRQSCALQSSILRLYSRRFRQDFQSDGVDVKGELSFLHEVLTAISEDAAHAGVTIAFENHSNFRAPELLELVNSIASPSLRVHLDIANGVSVSEDALTTVTELAPVAISGHIKDFTIESLYAPDGRHRIGFSVLWKYPGEGCAEIAPALEALGHACRRRTFPLTIEGLDHGRDDRNQRDKLIQCRTYLSSLGID